MNKGDTLKVVLDYSVNGTPIQEGYFDEMELQINCQEKRYALKLLLSKDEIVWDNDLGKYVAYLSQEQTYALRANSTCQLRVLKENTVSSSDIGEMNLGDVLSKEALA